MEKPKSLTLIIRTEEINMTIEMGSNDGQEQLKGAADKRILKILGQFSSLSPEKQEEVIKFVEYIQNQKEGNEAGQGPVT